MPPKAQRLAAAPGRKRKIPLDFETLNSQLVKTQRSVEDLDVSIVGRRRRVAYEAVHVLWAATPAWGYLKELIKDMTAYDAFREGEKNKEFQEWPCLGWFEMTIRGEAAQVLDNPGSATKGKRDWDEDDRRDAEKMLAYIMRKVAAPNEWLKFLGGGVYQYTSCTSGDHEETAKTGGFKTAQQLVETLYRFNAESPGTYVEGDRKFSELRVTWECTAEGDQRTALGQPAQGDGVLQATPINPMSLWDVLFQVLHQFQSSNADEEREVACAKAILALTKNERSDLAYHIIRNSPHVVATAESWPYMLAIALIRSRTANIEKEAGLPTTMRRYRDTVHKCLTRYHKDHTAMIFVPISHTFRLLQCMLQEDPVEVETASDEQDDLDGDGDDGDVGSEEEDDGNLHADENDPKDLPGRSGAGKEQATQEETNDPESGNPADDSRHGGARTEGSKDVNSLQIPADDLQDIDDDELTELPDETDIDETDEKVAENIAGLDADL
jgi:hypothetical protein